MHDLLDIRYTRIGSLFIEYFNIKLGGVSMSKTTKELKSRNEIPKERTWDLEAIFATDELWEQEFKKLQEDIPALADYQGKLSESAESLYGLFKLQDELSERLRSEERRVGKEGR